MAETTSIVVQGMTCTGCSGKVQEALEMISGVSNVKVSHEVGVAEILHSGVDRKEMVRTIQNVGYSIEGESTKLGFDWSNKSTWKQAANNTKWCLLGCSIGEFGTLAYYSYSGITEGLEIGSNIWIMFAILPLINGLVTSIVLETYMLMRGQMDFRNALSTAFGMSFISMLMMEISMEITDLLFTGGELGLNYFAIPLMLLVGFLTPWPYNYWRLEKYGVSCH
ncbi:MAG: DUF4396 domain-containing protein [Candidatus Thalassarchaeaceae archaeon]